MPGTKKDGAVLPADSPAPAASPVHLQLIFGEEPAHGWVYSIGV
ncbi:MAG: hypothetical protein PHE06_07770 [Lachnospiraceae bacterium]|nr:hypothetical protein [Lachnospiraceae bacterium]MDD3795848.1 hypothetical protein [Lachnospiraceae bacterium]